MLWREAFATPRSSIPGRPLASVSPVVVTYCVGIPMAPELEIPIGIPFTMHPGYSAYIPLVFLVNDEHGQGV